jgi:hypothetical protein
MDYYLAERERERERERDSNLEGLLTRRRVLENQYVQTS